MIWMKSRLVNTLVWVSAVVFVIWLSPRAISQGLPYGGGPLYVNADSGSDTAPTGDGTLGKPFASVNKALQRAWDFNQGISGGVQPIDTIYVQWSSRPIAPFDFGSDVPAGSETTGREQWGWEENGEPNTRRPFPIRMIDGVDIIGIPNSSGERPRILIDEVGEEDDGDAVDPPYDKANWWEPFDEAAEMANPGTQPDFWCVVRGANSAVLSGFHIDGSTLVDTSGSVRACLEISAPSVYSHR